MKNKDQMAGSSGNTDSANNRASTGLLSQDQGLATNSDPAKITAPEIAGAIVDGPASKEPPNADMREPGIPSTQLTFVRGLFGVFKKTDIPCVLQNIYPDLVYDGTLKESIPYAVEFSTAIPEDFKRTLNKIFADAECTLHKFYEQGNEVMVSGYLKGISQFSNQSIESNWIVSIEFKDNKPLRFHDYCGKPRTLKS